MTTPEIEELKRLIEKKYGKQLCTTTDFEEFTMALKKVGIIVSASTMKRLYGYVGDSHKPRVATLDQLANYIGHRSFAAFVEWLKTSTRYNSSFFNARQLVSATLQEGDAVEIGWAPNRQLILTYLGHSAFRVEESRNSKMQVATSSSRVASSWGNLSFFLISFAAMSEPPRLWQAATAD